MMDDSALRERYLSVLDRLGEAIARAGRKPEEVRLIAVSKLHPAEDVACVAAAGQVDFGENYVQEALQKRQDLVAQPQCRDIRWHMIGHVQSRKAAQVAGAFALVHTLDSVKLADALEKLTQREREIITLRFGLGGRREHTQKEVADRMGISQSYISRLEKRIIGRLKREILKVTEIP